MAAVTGAGAFSFLPREFGLPAVVSGFEPADLVYSVCRLADMLARREPALENEYTRLVGWEGNLPALKAVEEVFRPVSSLWRGPVSYTHLISAVERIKRHIRISAPAKSIQPATARKIR